MPLRTVLIVDDAAEDRMLLRRLLAHDTNYTYRFLEAETGSQSLALCHANTPDCVLLKDPLPDMSGTEALQAIVAEFGLNHFPIVMLSGDDRGLERVVAALRIGAQDFWVKDGLRVEDLHRAFSNAIEKVALHQQQIKVERDIRESHAVEDKVHVSEIRYRRLFEAAHDGVLLLDPDTRKITDANPFMTELLGYPHSCQHQYKAC